MTTTTQRTLPSDIAEDIRNFGECKQRIRSHIALAYAKVYKDIYADYRDMFKHKKMLYVDDVNPRKIMDFNTYLETVIRTDLLCVSRYSACSDWYRVINIITSHMPPDVRTKFVDEAEECILFPKPKIYKDKFW
jgi:hypothetical protein